MLWNVDEFLKDQLIKSRKAIDGKNFFDIHFLMLDNEYDNKFSFLTIINGNDPENSKATVLRLTKETINKFLLNLINNVSAIEEKNE